MVYLEGKYIEGEEIRSLVSVAEMRIIEYMIKKGKGEKASVWELMEVSGISENGVRRCMRRLREKFNGEVEVKVKKGEGYWLEGEIGIR